MRLLDREYLDHPTKGVLGMLDTFRLWGIQIDFKRICRLLRKMAIHAIYPKRNLSRLGSCRYVCSYKLRGLEISRCNLVLSIDITYIPMERVFYI